MIDSFILSLSFIEGAYQIAESAATLLSAGVARAGDALERALPYIQQALDYLINNGPEVVSVLGKLAAAFAAMQLAPAAEGLLRGAGSLLGGAELTDCAYDVYRITGVRGSTSLHMLQGFDQLDGLMISGSLHVTAPMDSVDAVLHTVTGRLRTQGVALVQDAPRASVTTVSGHFEMNSSLLAATYEEE